MAGFTRTKAMEMAIAIRQNIPNSKPCRDLAIKAVLEVLLRDNPALAVRRFREVANGTLEEDVFSANKARNWKNQWTSSKEKESE